MKLIKISLLLLIIPCVVFPQETISDSNKKSTIESIKQLIHTNYVFANRAKDFNNSLDSLNLTGKYNDITDYKAFADALTEDLVKISSDKHFKVQYNPELVKSRAESARLQKEIITEKEIEDEMMVFNMSNMVESRFSTTTVVVAFQV